MKRYKNDDALNFDLEEAVQDAIVEIEDEQLPWDLDEEITKEELDYLFGENDD